MWQQSLLPRPPDRPTTPRAALVCRVRVARVEMAPLSLSEAWEQPPSALYALLSQGAAIEALQAAATPNLSAQQVRQYWFTGGYPEPWLNNSEVFRQLWQLGRIRHQPRAQPNLRPSRRARYRRWGRL